MNELDTLTFNDDPRSAAEIVADRFGFKLAYHDFEDERYYAVQDWITGVAQTDNAGHFWYDLQRRVKKSLAVELSSLCVKLPYRATNGKTYRMDHAKAELLYYITQRMDAETGIRDVVMKYLAKAGVIGDTIRLDPGAAADALENIASEKEYHREYKKLIAEGFTSEEAVEWLDTRAKQKRQRKTITAIWKARGIKAIQDFAILTNKTHQVATGRTATEHKRELAIKDTPRNHVSSAENATIQITEFTAGLLHETPNSLGMGELSEDIDDVRPIIDAARPEINRVFSQKPRRLRGQGDSKLLKP